MFSLSTHIKNIIIDLDLINNSYFSDSNFIKLLFDLREKYNLYLLSDGSRGIEGLKTIKKSDLHSFSTFMKEFEIVPMHSIILTSSHSEIDKAHKFNISTILLIEDEGYLNSINHNYLPDKILNIEYLRSFLIEERNIGTFNELSIQKNEGWGLLFPLGKIKHQLSDDVNANLIYAGRYFTFEDPRSYIHCLSNMLLRLKKIKSYAVESLAYCLNKNINITRDLYNDINIIAVVPAKPNSNNHLDLVLNHSILKEHRSIIDTNLLYTVRDYKKQKHAGSFFDRAINVLDAFDSKRSITGHVLLIDDILTSGSTTMECAKVLYKYGAEKVTILPLAIMQSNSNAPCNNKIKDKYDREYRLNFKSRNGDPFWVASDREYLDYDLGKERFLSQNTCEDYQGEDCIYKF